MSTNDRHLAALAWAVESAGLDQLGPIDSSVVTGPSAARLDAARQRAHDDLESAQSHRRRLDASLDQLRRDRMDALAAIAAAEEAASEASERRQRLEADADGALERLTQMDTRLAELAAEIERTAVQSSAADDLDTAVQQQVDALGGSAVSTERQHDAAKHLEELAAAASALGLHTPAEALGSWSDDLASGTAALHPRAAALSVELAEVEREWQEHGAGELERAPAVIAAQAELHEAQLLLAEVEAEARSGGLGQRARARIDDAHRLRQSIEAKGRKADPRELSAALDTETAALRQVGFDSILDYRVAMSTRGSGALVDACLRNARERASQLGSSLEEARRITSSTLEQLGSRRQELLHDAEELTGNVGERSIEQALEGCLDTPAPVRSALTEIHLFCAATRELLQSDRAELDTLRDEQRIVERGRALALSGAVIAVDDAENAEQAGRRAHEQVVDIDHLLGESTRQLAEVDRALVEAESALEVLTHCRYLDEDVREFSSELIAAVERNVDALDDDGASSVVIDDPLGGFEDEDALAVLDDLVDREWSAPVLFVTSRPKLVSRLRRQRGQVRCVDGRRREPGQHHWWRRHARASAQT